MLKYKFLSVLFFLFTISIFSQKSLNEYKYVIVPVQYHFQKTASQYQINELVKFLFEKDGFTVFLSTDKYPSDLYNNRCLAVTANLNKTSSFLSTNIGFELVDCDNKMVFSTNFAKSKEKDYKTAYHEVIRKAFEDVKAQNYSYEPSESDAVVITPAFVATQTIEVKETPKQKVVETKTTETPAETTTISTPKVAVTATAVVVTKNETPVVEEVDHNTLYAQAIASGYQLVDSTPKVIYIALKTALVDVYLIKGEDGIIYKSNGNWVAEYYADGKLVRKVLTIKLL